MTGLERQIVLGMLLGNGYIEYPTNAVTPRLCFWHGKRTDPNWTNYRSQCLKELASETPFTTYPNGRSKWMSSCDKVWEEFISLCYVGGKKEVTVHWLDPLSDTAWSVWFLDRGSLVRGKLHLGVGRHSASGIAAMQEYFANFDMICSPYRNKLRFDRSATERFFKTCAHQIPTFMQYRLYGV